MALESRETSKGLAPQLEGRHAVRDALLCVRDDRKDRVAQLGKRCSLGLIKSAEVLVDLFLRHSCIFNVGAERVKAAQARPRAMARIAPPRLPRPRRGVAGGRPGRVEVSCRYSMATAWWQGGRPVSSPRVWFRVPQLFHLIEHPTGRRSEERRV